MVKILLHLLWYFSSLHCEGRGAKFAMLVAHRDGNSCHPPGAGKRLRHFDRYAGQAPKPQRHQFQGHSIDTKMQTR